MFTTVPLLALLAFAFFFGFFIESIVGVGGTLIAFAFLLFFADIKTLIVSTIIVSFLASFLILASDYKNIAWRSFKKFTPVCLLGIPVGIFLFDYLSNAIIVKILAGFLVIFGLRTVLFGEIKLHGKPAIFVVFLSGIVHGLIGVGGPVAIIGMKSSFQNKSELRSTMALFFIVLNLFRITQLGIMYGEAKIFLQYAWVIFPVWAGVILGHKIHKKISEEHFKKILSIFFIIMGILLFFR